MKVKHYETEPHAHFLTFSCYQNLWLFKHPELYHLFLDNLVSCRDRLGFDLWAFVLMPNHVHLLLFLPPDVSISKILYAVKRPFSYRAGCFLKEHYEETWEKMQARHSRRVVTRFWQRGGGFDRNIFGIDALNKTIQYIHYNPVRKGLVKSPTEWKWSSVHYWERKSSEPIMVDRPWFWKE